MNDKHGDVLTQGLVDHPGGSTRTPGRTTIPDGEQEIDVLQKKGPGGVIPIFAVRFFGGKGDGDSRVAQEIFKVGLRGGGREVLNVAILVEGSRAWRL